MTTDWAEAMRARMFERRVVVVSGALDDETAGHAAMELMTLDAAGDGPIHLQIDSLGGSLDAALSLMDVVELTGVAVRGMCVGLVGGPAVGLLAVCHHRMITPHGRIRLVEADDAFAGSAGDLVRWAEDRQARWAVFCRRLATAAGRPVAKVVDDLRSSRFLDADDAVRYGLVDEVCRPEATIHRLPSWPIGFRPR